MMAEDAAKTRQLSRGQPLVYLVDDEVEICALLSDTLQSYGFQTAIFHAGHEAYNAIADTPPAMLIIDLGLPDIDGMALIERIREKTSVPILVLSARTHASDRVIGLELGADDYVCKPFDPREIVARARSLLRRATPTAPKTETGKRRAQFAGWQFEPDSHLLRTPQGEESFLSTGESVLLQALLSAPRRVLSRDQLLEYGGNDESMDRSIDVRISRIRKKLNSSDTGALIRTVYGSGYMLTADVRWIT
ncbi:response regulator transcription factor [Pseudovibrio sp. SPO723]|uniref:response regulator transcription factor n=1 Tax=Nesiotobacter zosterae TaxID=392721 RepID=UPI0029C4E66F|nr:response regulator transcription factor [Pseudovibrio sp. SPO723]MDX5594730.1 response regulator transcription factor [Pseudovibrio sp. SPO723]